MKKNILNVVALIFIAGATLLSSCVKDDTTPPVITLKGSKTMVDTLNKPFVDPGATAYDNTDGNISFIDTMGTVDYNLVGSYVITYVASDASGNKMFAKRTVNVINADDYLAANYSVYDSTYNANNSGTSNYAANITSSIDTNNVIAINNFGNFGSSIAITAKISGNSVIIKKQSPAGMATPAAIQGSGTYNPALGTLTINYTANYGGGNIINGFAIYTKNSSKKKY